MKRVIICISIFSIIIGVGDAAFARDKKIQFSVSEPDAKIYVNNIFHGTGNVIFVVPAYKCVVVKVEKSGFITGYIEFCNKPEYEVLPTSYHYTMIRDDVSLNTDEMDIAIVDVEITTTIKEDAAWKAINRVILSYFDEIELTDPTTGYLKTSWVGQSFTEITVRTRVIVKLVQSEPLMYRVKLVSEKADRPKTSIKSDEQFSGWNRVVNKYVTLIADLESILKN